MLTMTMKSAAAQALRACGRALPSKSLSARVALVRRSFLIAPSHKSPLVGRGFATAAAKKTTTSRAAKPAAKKTTTKKAATTGRKKTVKKSTATAKAAKAAKPRSAATPAKKPRSERQKLLLKQDLKRELKKAALINQEPTKLPTNNWMVFMHAQLKADNNLVGTNLGPIVKQMAVDFKALPESEKQRLAQQAEENKVINAANYKKWVESHPVADIIAAVKARQRLNRDFGMNITPAKIIDERPPKRPAFNGFAYYTKANFANGNATSFQDAAALGKQWNSLPATEKKPFNDLALAENQKWRKEMEKYV